MRRQKALQSSDTDLLLQSVQLKCWLNLPLTWKQMHVLWLQRKNMWKFGDSDFRFWDQKKDSGQQCKTCVIDRFSMRQLPHEALRKDCVMKWVDFFLPTLDTFRMFLRSRFNSECTKVLKLISSVVQYADNFRESVRQLASLAQLNADLCVAEGNVLMKNKDYKPS